MNVADIVSNRKFVYAVATIILAMHFNPLYTIQTGTRGVITQFGVIQSVASEGLIVLPPWKNLEIFNVRAVATKIENAKGMTNDAQPVQAALTVRYNIEPNRVAEIYERYSRDGNLSSVVESATQEAIRVVTAKYSAVEILARREQISVDISKVVRMKLRLYGANLISIEVLRFSFSEENITKINRNIGNINCSW